MSRRLAEMSDESLETGGRGARKIVEEAGFSEELKARLEEKIANASFRSENANAFAQANMPAGASKGAQDIAAAQPWMGTESLIDASSRMLQDAHKPMRVRGAARPPAIRGAPSKVDTGRPGKRTGTGTRLASARDRTSVYAFLKDENMSEEEREKYRKELKDRFQPGARATPATITGLASLANERIEDAIARGQFKNLPRGKQIERDYNASNPFLDTTEYFMNKMIQKQEIVPPWIEKQQEVVSTAARFRGQLRASWRRHVSRTIASRGGGLEKQMNMAEEYAFSESIDNPPKKKVEKLNAVDDQGHMSQITLSGETKAAPENDATLQESEITVLEQALNDDGTLRQPAEKVTVTTAPHEAKPGSDDVLESTTVARKPTVPPFRDPQWEQTERSYHELAVNNLNTITRAYNLMAPQLAQKPYFNLARELRSCYADVAPQVAEAIRERALAPKIRGVEVVGHKPGGVLDKFSMDTAVRVHDEVKPQYGFKEFWRDLFAQGKT